LKQFCCCNGGIETMAVMKHSSIESAAICVLAVVLLCWQQCSSSVCGGGIVYCKCSSLQNFFFGQLF
jgi:hypothetical protein